MLKMQKLLVISMVALLLISFSFAVAAQEINIGLIPMTLSNEYFIALINGAEQRAELYDVELTVQGPQTHADALAQLEQMENMISRGVDAIVIVPSSSEALAPALLKAEEAGIPVINLDTKFNQETLANAGVSPIPFIGTDNYVGALDAGKLALELLDGEGQVAILEGISGQQNTYDRKNGFIDGMENKLDVVATQTADWEVEKGYNAAQNIMQANPELDLIFGSNDGMAIGAYRAILEAGKEDEIFVIGYDAVPAALESVKEGELYATIAQFPAEMGKRGIDAAMQIINGEQIALKDSESTVTTPITQENVEAMMNYLDNYID
ncbi:Ribose ABC transport system, periplasmic ribose-binding protein RbsB (TC 3.A.1.2.1) [Halanaerobium saccharolyticum subsp. saccharolyticum DSM 6643]|uniref:Ribose ABC transport system, periplasmic ribose-binding protein RbsB (TC 3.A.1.2.1) n=1 Tax=Halanaerobium saccharolyticum subsp. saccharolyticum DSM 6643 TaxID=1293054 RepID=M5DYG3_9FIRM|nr:sugar ABC transporter substrate-binding protein [Halanaerobium saccharolyticum]CCU78642.1 Ribose ABC transport system, periplasmic ribose-binding protein RbsB (TC 3.A.1.2.1) [Halanaerobium saccharolyticum subsp. saccharolyticum DSM 6643]